jgi:hypothetical protein
MRHYRQASVAALLAGMLACSKGPDSSGVSAQIGPEGGSLKADGVTFSVPQGALNDVVTISLTVLDTGGTEVPGRIRVSKVFQILPDTVRFLTPATVTLSYQSALVPASIAPTSVDVRHTDYSRLTPERLGSIHVDTDATTVSGETTGLGTFWATAPEGPRPISIVVTPATSTVYVGDQATFAAEVHDQYDRIMTGQTVVWSLSNKLVATLDDSGTATAIDAGSTDVVAKVGAASGKATLQVASPAPFVKSFDWASPLPTASDLWAVHGNAQAIAVAGEHGTVAVLAGGSWTRVSSIPLVQFRDLALQDQSVVAVGTFLSQGLLVLSDASTTTRLVVPDTDLVSVWVDGDHGMAVGDGPNLAMRDATGAWVSSSSPVTEPLLAVDGVGGEPVVVGARGAVYQLKADAWVPLSGDPLPEFQIDAVASGAEAWAISTKTLRHFKDGAWKPVALPATPVLTLEHVALAGSALAIAGKDAAGHTWVLVDDGTGFKGSSPPEEVNGMGGSSPTDLYAVGPKGFVGQFDGTSWTDLRLGVAADVAGLAAFDGPVVYAAVNTCADAACTQRTGSILQRDSQGRFAPVNTPFSTELLAIAGRSPTDIWAVGNGNLAYHLEGTIWANVPVADGNIRCVTVCGDTVWACGGTVLTESGIGLASAFKDIAGPTAIACTGAGLFVVGNYGTWVVEGTKVTPVDPGDDHLNSAPWRTVWATVDGHAFMGGDARYLLHWTGAKFEAFDQPGNVPIVSTHAIWGTSFGNVWAGGVTSAGTSFLIHFNGAYWTAVDSGIDGALNAISGLSSGEMWIGGDSGALLHGAAPVP